jgi:hypothetical protein
MIQALLLVLLFTASSPSVSTSPGVATSAPRGYVVSNIDPNFNSTYNDGIYAPNFQPGFEAGLTNTTILWNSGNGYGKLRYSVGPWAYEESPSIPHFAVGPQCCNFKEVPHTQQFTRAEWADHYYSRAGLGPPGVNVENYTAVWGDPPSYVGLRTDWEWTVQFSLNWTPPVIMTPANGRGAIGIAVTQYVPSAPGKLVYTLVNLWMDTNSSKIVTRYPDGTERGVVSPTVVVYHPVQVTGQGNETITINISPYLEDTLRVLGLPTVQKQPPVISQAYLNVEGYNFEWNATLWSFKLMSPQYSLLSANPFALWTLASVLVAVATVLLYRVWRTKLFASHREPQAE